MTLIDYIKADPKLAPFAPLLLALADLFVGMAEEQAQQVIKGLAASDPAALDIIRQNATDQEWQAFHDALVAAGWNDANNAVAWRDAFLEIVLKAMVLVPGLLLL